MLKKLVFVFVIMMIGFSVFGQVVSEADGNDWAEWDYNFKVGYMFGWFAANDTVWEWMYLSTDASTNDEVAEDLSLLYEYAGETVDSLIGKVNSYYAKNPEYSEHTINKVILYMCGKDYWNWTKEEISMEDNA